MNSRTHTVDQITDLIVARATEGKRLIVFVCGHGGAGKTTFCHQLAAKLPCRTVVFETDWYAKYATVERRSRIKSALESGDAQIIEQEENPQNWYNWTELTNALDTLRTTGKLTIRNGWSQRTGEKDLSIDLELPPLGDSVIICDGIYLLHDEIRSVADMIVLIDRPLSECLAHGAARDSHRSSPEYLKYKAELTNKYDKPYFERFRKNAHYLACGRDRIE